MGIFVLSLVTCAFLKLYSYIHFWNDVRLFLKKRQNLIKSDPQSKQLQGNVYKEIEEVIHNYPQNLIFTDLLKFLAMPVLCFQYKYPTTNRIKKRSVINYTLQFICCIFLLV